MPSSGSAERSRLEVSERVVLVLLDHGYGQTIAEICRRVNVPQRTFYNYFGTKPEVVRPILERGIRVLVDAVAAVPPTEPLEEAMLVGFRESLWGRGGEYTRRLVPLLLREPALYAVWLSTIRSFEAEVASTLGPRFGLVPGTAAEHMIAATLVTAVRISFEHMAEHQADPVDTFRAALSAVSFPGIAR